MNENSAEMKYQDFGISI